MYLITIDGLTDEKLLKNIYTNIGCFGLANKLFLLYKFDFTKSKVINKRLLANAFIVELNELEGLSESEIEDIILDLIELNSNILIQPYTGNNKDFEVSIYSAINDFGLKFMWYKPFNFDRDISLDNLTFNDYQIILEIFEEPMEANCFNRKNFLFRYIVDNEGKIYGKDSKIILDLNNEQFISIITKPYGGIENIIDEETKNYNECNIFSTNMYEPLPFLIEDDHINEKIIKYKYKVFETVKNVKPEDYPCIAKEVIDLFNNSGYIQFNDILKIIEE